LQRNYYRFVGFLIFLAIFAVHSPGVASPIHDAVLEGEIELVEILIANGADVDERDVHGYTPPSSCNSAGKYWCGEGSD
jgi:ankyrin repeat protein